MKVAIEAKRRCKSKVHRERSMAAHEIPAPVAKTAVNRFRQHLGRGIRHWPGFRRETKTSQQMPRAWRMGRSESCPNQPPQVHTNFDLAHIWNKTETETRWKSLIISLAVGRNDACSGSPHSKLIAWIACLGCQPPQAHQLPKKQTPSSDFLTSYWTTTGLSCIWKICFCLGVMARKELWVIKSSSKVVGSNHVAKDSSFCRLGAVFVSSRESTWYTWFIATNALPPDHTLTTKRHFLSYGRSGCASQFSRLPTICSTPFDWWRPLFQTPFLHSGTMLPVSC